MYRNARPAGYRRSSWLKRQLARRPRPVWMLIVMDILLIGISLVVFALFHHVLPRHEESTGLVSDRYQAAVTSEAAPAATQLTSEPSAEVSTVDTSTAIASTTAGSAEVPAEPAATVAPEATVEPEVPAAPLGYFGDRFPDMFTDGQIYKTSESYRSPNVNISLNQYEYEGSTFHLANIYIKDIECFRTAFAKDKFGRGLIEKPDEINRRAGGILAVNGDYYGTRTDGVVIRNGELYRDKTLSMDVCVLYWDGTLETYSQWQFNARQAMENGAYQAWHFGPMLLDSEGKPLTSFSNASIGPKNPRTVLGYFEPGHYCFVVIDGRSKASEGLTIREMAQLMSDLGCKRAYNMDGGATSMMVVGDKVVSNPYKGGRPSSDIILIADKA